jgi:adenine-specific DNA-methyltransferase
VSETINLLIEGDNLHALNVLGIMHYKKIDTIIIDPPYNTKNKDFIYNDNYVDAEDAWRHSKWVSFMKRRLEISRDLLTTDGVIFIHIDENEFAQLKLLCDEIFYEKNYIGTFIWKSRSGKGGTADKVSTLHEYIFCYAKDSSQAHMKTDKKVGKARREQLRQWGQEVLRENRKTMFFPLLYKPDTGDKAIISREEIEFFFHGTSFDDDALMQLKKKYEKKGWKFILPIIDGKFGRWRIGYDKISELLDNDEIIFEISDEGEEYVAYRLYPEGNVTETAKGSLLLDLGTASTGTEEIKRVFNGEKIFDTAKPLDVTKFLIDIATYNKPRAIIMDFFAGSGTVGIATMEYNKEHGGNRSFILCTNNEVSEKKDAELGKMGILKGTEEYELEGVCNKATYPRLKRVITGYEFSGKERTLLFKREIKNITQIKKISHYLIELEEIKKDNTNNYDKFETKFDNAVLTLTGVNTKVSVIEGLGGNLKYFKTGFVEKTKNKDQMQLILASEVYELLSIKENCFDLIKESDYYRIYKRNDKVVGIYIHFLDTQIDDFKKNLLSIKAKKKVLYAFSFNEHVENLELQEMKDIQVKTIPSKIIEMLEKVHN